MIFLLRSAPAPSSLGRHLPLEYQSKGLGGKEGTGTVLRWSVTHLSVDKCLQNQKPNQEVPIILVYSSQRTPFLILCLLPQSVPLISPLLAIECGCL